MAKISKRNTIILIIWGVIVIAAAIAFILIFFGTGNNEYIYTKDTESEPEEKPESLEYKLATIEKGYVSRDDIIITRFRSILRQLDDIYVEGKQEISDLTVVAVQKLLRDKYGINESLLNVMEGLNQINPSRENPEYRIYATAYVQLRNQGFIHQEALNKVESYLDSIGR